MRARTLLAALLGCLVTTGVLAGTPAGAVGPDPRVRLTGDLVRTTVEGPGGGQHFGVRVGGRLVPVSGTQLTTAPPRARVTVDVTVPQPVADAAAANRALRVPTVHGPARHELTRGDVVAASDATPATAGSDLGTASIDAALSPGASALEVSRVVSAQSATAATYTPATRAITFVEVTPRGLTREPVTTASATEQVAAADAYWRDQSRGELGLGAPTMKPHYTSIYSCSDDPIARFDEAVQRVGYSFAANTSLVLRLPRSAEIGCGYGLGLLGEDPNSGGVLHVADSRWPVLAHEIGHNMSLEHANALTCGDRSDGTETSSGWSTCREVPYGDGLDVMGVSGDTAGMLSAPQALATGMLAPAGAVRVDSGTQTVTLRPVSGREGIRAAVVTNRRTGERYWVEYRTASGRDASNPEGQSTGVRVLRRNSSTGASVLLDPTPTGGYDHSTHLAVGRTLRSHDGSIHVTTESATDAAAVVRIRNGVFTAGSPPVISGTKGVGKPLTASTGSWWPTPTSYGYRWRRDGVAISGATSRTYTPTVGDAGHSLTVTVTARRTGYTSASARSAPVGIPIHATTRPSISGNPTVWRTLTVMVGSWTPQPSSYAYRWYRDGVAISGATGRSYQLRSADRGHAVKARVTARRTGMVSGAAFSQTVTVR